MSPHVRFYVISDAALYEELRSLFPGIFPKQKFAFLGHTFGDAFWPHGWKRNLLPTSRLFLKWVQMNEISSKIVIPALNKKGADYVAVFICGYGREAYHYAVRHRCCAETLPIHEDLVASRLVRQRGRKPDSYFAKKPQEERCINADEAYFEKGKGQTMTYLRSDSLRGQVREICVFVANQIGIEFCEDAIAA